MQCSWNAPIQAVPLRPVEVAPEAIEVIEQQPLAQIHETQLADYPFLDFEDVRAFFECVTTCSALNTLYVHRPFKNEQLKNFELFCGLASLS